MSANEYSTDQIRHSAAHILAIAAARLYPDVKIGVGPVTKDGFYYDFEFPETLTWEQIKRLEGEMNLVIQEDLPFTQIYVPKENAYQILLTRGQVYKAELLKEIPESEVSFFKTGEEFIDLCRGPHVASTSHVGAIKLTSVTSVNWRNDENRPKMQRVSGLAFRDIAELREHMAREEEIQGRDFRKLAKDMGISIGGSRQTIYTAKGSEVITQIENRIIEQYDQFYQIRLPVSKSIAESCDNLDQLYSSKNRSYRELPIKYVSSGRQEMHSPMYIMEKDIFSVNTVIARSYLDLNQFHSEFGQHLQAAITALESLELEFNAVVSVPSQTHIGLDIASSLLHRANVSQTQIVDATIPSHQMRVDFNVKDSFEREWHLTNIVQDAGEPQFVSKTGEFSTSLHVTTTWVLEKILGYFLEEYEGGFPMWLSPVQAIVIPITEQQIEYATHIEKLLEAEGYRAETDRRSETMQSRIRDAELQKIPVLLIIGEKEVSTGTVSLRLRNKTEVGLLAENELFQTLKTLKV